MDRDRTDGRRHRRPWSSRPPARCPLVAAEPFAGAAAAGIRAPGPRRTARHRARIAPIANSRHATRRRRKAFIINGSVRPSRREPCGSRTAHDAAGGHPPRPMSRMPYATNPMRQIAHPDDSRSAAVFIAAVRASYVRRGTKTDCPSQGCPCPCPAAPLRAGDRPRPSRRGRAARRRLQGGRPVRRLAGQPRDLVVGRRDPRRLQPGHVQGSGPVPPHRSRPARGVPAGPQPRRRRDLDGRAAQSPGRPRGHARHAARHDAGGRSRRSIPSRSTSRSTSPAPASR